MKAAAISLARALLTLAGLVLALPGQARAEERLVIVTPHWEGIRNEYAAAFRQFHQREYGTPVQVDWLILGGTSEIRAFLRQSFDRRPDGIDVDIFWGGGVDPYIELAKQGRLERCEIDARILAEIPAEYAGARLYDPGRRWFGTALSGFGILFNRAVLQRVQITEPASWEDLARPEFFSWVGSGDPRHSGSVRVMYEIMLQAWGWERGFDVIRRMGANARSFPRGSGRTPLDVAVGDVAAGLVIDQYAAMEIARAGSSDLVFVLPEGKTAIVPDAIGILKGAPHAQLAQRFVNFVLSAEGQKLLMLPAGAPEGPRTYTLGRRSVMRTLYDEIAARGTRVDNPFSWKSQLHYDFEKASARATLLQDLIGALVLDTQDELRRAWQAVIRAGMPAAAVRRLAEMPLTEEEAKRLWTPDPQNPKKSLWADQAVRHREIARWTRFARAQYADVERLAGQRRGAVEAALPWILPVLAAVLAGAGLLYRLQHRIGGGKPRA